MNWKTRFATFTTGRKVRYIGNNNSKYNKGTIYTLDSIYHTDSDGKNFWTTKEIIDYGCVENTEIELV